MVSAQAKGLDLTPLMQVPPGGDCTGTLSLATKLWAHDPNRVPADAAAGAKCTELSGRRFEGLGEYDLRPQLATLQKRVLVVVPEGSPFGTEMALASAEALTRSSVTVLRLAECGHGPFLECPAAFFRGTRQFFEGEAHSSRVRAGERRSTTATPRRVPRAWV